MWISMGGCVLACIWMLFCLLLFYYCTTAVPFLTECNIIWLYMYFLVYKHNENKETLTFLIYAKRANSHDGRWKQASQISWNIVNTEHVTVHMVTWLVATPTTDMWRPMRSTKYSSVLTPTLNLPSYMLPMYLCYSGFACLDCTDYLWL